MVGYVFPSLLLGIVFVLVFALTLHLLPATGFVPFDQSPLGWLGSIILPSATLAVGATASVAAQVRGSVINELSKDYVRTLRSRGISNRNVVFRHVLRNASGPALTTLSLSFIGMFGGALIIEQIFALSGFGQYSYTSTIQSDLPAIVGVVAVTVCDRRYRQPGH
ncbi:MAG: ABC transporter permease [Galbitalea sp.]